VGDITLKPCPFCSGAGRLTGRGDDQHGYQAVECVACGVRTRSFYFGVANRAYGGAMFDCVPHYLDVAAAGRAVAKAWNQRQEASRG
jgi:hypothetical protein